PRYRHFFPTRRSSDLILSRIPLLKYWSGPGVQDQSGSGYTVKAATRTHGPSERFTANLADLDQSTLNVVTGQSGNFLSPHYMDQDRKSTRLNSSHGSI